MRKPYKWNLNKAIELKEKGYRYSEIAKELGVKPITIQTYFLNNFGKLKTTTNEAKEVKLTKKQQEILFGGLLGDCSLNRSTKNAQGKIEHCLDQLDYVIFKRKNLVNISGKLIKAERFDNRTNKVYKSCRFTLLCNPALNTLYTSFYPSGKKIVPLNLDLLTPLAIAIWYMDDGTKETHGYRIYTMSFSLNDVKRLSKKLLEYNIHTTVRKDKTLYIRAKSKKTFKNLINKFVIDSMKYKL